jgi:tetratricopeptide (TPR) repeat protein
MSQLSSKPGYKEDFFRRSDIRPALEQTGRPDQPRSTNRARELSGGSQVLLGALGHAYGASGDRAKAIETMNALKNVSPEARFSAFEVAIIHTGLGEKEKAFEWLQKALDEHNEYLQLLQIDPRLKPLRSDPRFTALVKAIGLN